MKETAYKREIITQKQLIKLWTCAHETGLAEDILRDVVERVSGQRSTRALTKYQAIKVIDLLEDTGSLPVSKGNPKVIALVTPKQLSLIQQLKAEAGWTDEHLASYILKYFKRDDLRKLTRYQGGVVIHVLQKEKQKIREAV